MSSNAKEADKKAKTLIVENKGLEISKPIIKNNCSKLIRNNIAKNSTIKYLFF